MDDPNVAGRADAEALPEPISVDCRARPISELLGLEYLLTNRLGSYASSTVVGANTRRYHGLLVAATQPPVGRQVVLSLLMPQIVVGEKTIDLATYQFAGALSPMGYLNLVRFVNDPVPTWLYEHEGITVTQQLTLAEQSNALAVRFRVSSPTPVALRVWPFVALRDFHSLRRVHEPNQMVFVADSEGIRVEDRRSQAAPAWVVCPGARFTTRPQWWYRFQYPVDVSRGQEGFEDLYTPGCFQWDVAGPDWRGVTCSTERHGPVDFEAQVSSRQARLARLAESVGPGADDATRRLAVATDAFIAVRQLPAPPGEPASSHGLSVRTSPTVLAGYHWFADWGRDSFISLPGLALATGQFAVARDVLRTFSRAVQDGIVPNRFDDYGGPPAYNSIDASLWFILAVDRYTQATGDEELFHREFLPTVRDILRRYHDGTRFGIHADGDGLILGGDADTQLTWMDVKFNNQAITPRHGKPVEINALYHEALCVMAGRCRGVDDAAADFYAAEAPRVAESFARAFWYEDGGYLYDCVGPGFVDASLRPNQIIAVSLPHCPLDLPRQRRVVEAVRKNLLTPVGLRSLSPADSRYRGSYGASWESRDRAYHQGTVWAWLIGPMVQAYLKVNGFSDEARLQAGEWLRPFDDHLRQAGLGSVSEIFDGDAPHEPRGCIAQAWSVAEVLRAKLMVQRGEIV